jgi:hypothetical protein
MLARLHTLEATPEQYEAGFQIVKDDLLPWARESTGFCGAIGLVDAGSGKALLLTLWSDEEARTESATAAERLSSLAADASGARKQSTENFEVSLFDLVGDAPVIR